MAEPMTGLIPHLAVSDARAALKFYKDGLGATDELVMPAKSGKIMHASVIIHGSHLFVCDDFPEFCGGKSRLLPVGTLSPTTLHLNVANCDEAMAKAVAAGATISMPAMDAFWGSRYGKVLDPFGHEWSFSHPLTVEQKAAAEKAWAAIGGM